MRVLLIVIHRRVEKLSENPVDQVKNILVPRAGAELDPGKKLARTQLIAKLVILGGVDHFVRNPASLRVRVVPK